MSEQQDFIRTIDLIFERGCDRSVREAAEQGGIPQELWKTLDEVGVTQATLPEDQGGPGLAFSDAMAILRRSAYHAAPIPLAETLLGVRMLARAGLAVPAGPLTVAPVRSEDKLSLIQGEGGRFFLSGSAHRVPWGDACEFAVVAAQCGGSDYVALVSTKSSRGVVERNLAGEPRVTLNFDALAVEACAPLDQACSLMEHEGALMRSVQIWSALERILEYSITYANERVQFGRPIGKFQAVQHMLALLAGHAAACSAAVSAAVEQPDSFRIAVAKSRAGEAAGRGAEIAHQVHAAMGFTREHSLHYSTRRLWSWREEFGNETYWQTRIGRLVAGLGVDALWPFLAES